MDLITPFGMGCNLPHSCFFLLLLWSCCSILYNRPPSRLVELMRMQVPSVAKFNSAFGDCNRSCDTSCIGPARSSHIGRLQKLYHREFSQFQAQYVPSYIPILP